MTLLSTVVCADDVTILIDHPDRPSSGVVNKRAVELAETGGLVEHRINDLARSAPVRLVVVGTTPISMKPKAGNERIGAPGSEFEAVWAEFVRICLVLLEASLEEVVGRAERCAPVAVADGFAEAMLHITAD